MENVLKKYYIPLIIALTAVVSNFLWLKELPSNINQSSIIESTLGSINHSLLGNICKIIGN